MSANSLNIFFNFIDVIFLNLNYKKINDCGLTFFRTTLSLAVIKVSPEAAGGLPESSPEKKKKKSNCRKWNVQEYFS